ncbi:MAG: DUF3109 family protein [Chitinophagales bacterium]|nr:DUF3109 family protein [Chitinophagales bacterium]
MILIDNKLISDEVIEEQFVCNLSACKGVCCIEGESGAPIEEHELALLEQNYDVVKAYLLPEGIAAIEQQGLYTRDADGIAKTTLVGGVGGPCAYVNFTDGITWCGIEKAWEDGKITFRKPVSCHLYPIRITRAHDMEYVNYFEWEVCNDACILGKSLKVPVYRFLKEALIRKYGEDFYETLEATIQYMNQNMDAEEL